MAKAKPPRALTSVFGVEGCSKDSRPCGGLNERLGTNLGKQDIPRYHPGFSLVPHTHPPAHPPTHPPTHTHNTPRLPSPNPLRRPFSFGPAGRSRRSPQPDTRHRPQPSKTNPFPFRSSENSTTGCESELKVAALVERNTQGSMGPTANRGYS